MRNKQLVSMPVPPDDEWLVRVPSGNSVYLVKEDIFAEVEWVYEPPDPRSICGRIGLRFPGGRRDTWFVGQSGQGIDGSQCLLPVVGHLPEEPPELPPQYVRHVLLRLDRLEAAVFHRPRVPQVIIDMPTTNLVKEKP